MKYFSFPPKLEALMNGLPFKKKLLIYLGSLAGVIAAFVFLLIGPSYKQFTQLRGELDEAQGALLKVKGTAANLERFKAELQSTQAEFQKALLLLPDQKEIPTLLTNISNLGNEAGLEFLLFKPKDEIQKDFYVEIPIEIIVLGPYHNVAVFFDKVSQLSRIVSMSGVNMVDPTIVHGNMFIRTSCVATTYRFTGTKVEEKEKDKKDKKENVGKVNKGNKG